MVGTLSQGEAERGGWHPVHAQRGAAQVGKWGQHLGPHHVVRSKLSHRKYSLTISHDQPHNPQMQACGQPPKEIVDELAPGGEGLGGEGFPLFGGGAEGGAQGPGECCVQ